MYMWDPRIISMLKRIKWKHGIIEISDLWNNLWWLEDYEKIIKMDKDLYFVWFIPNDNWHDANRFIKWRSRDSYAKWVSYVKADFDIRSYIYEHNNKIISDEDLLSYRDVLEKWLKQDPLLSTYNAIVFSWNWRHFYWIWEEVIIDQDLYSRALTGLYERIKKIFINTPELYPDFMTVNISRLMRLPWSKNHKWKYGLPPKEVKLMYYSDEDSLLMTKLIQIWEDTVKKESLRVSREIKKLETYSKSSCCFFDNPMYTAINTQINIADLVCKYTNWKLASNGTNFISNRDWWFTGAYLIPEKNVVIYKWTPHLSNFYNVYSPFAFIKVHYANGDNKRTFEIAREMFPNIKPVNSNLYFNEKISYGLMS